MSPSVAGVHFCLGVALARMEARTAFSAMLHHMPNWNTERIGDTAGAHDHSAATPPSPPGEPRQHSRGTNTHRPNGHGLALNVEDIDLGEGPVVAEAGSEATDLLLDGLRERADPRKHCSVSRHGWRSDDCGVDWLWKCPSVDVCGQYARIVRH
jgi:hypothetical protein